LQTHHKERDEADISVGNLAPEPFLPQKEKPKRGSTHWAKKRQKTGTSESDRFVRDSQPVKNNSPDTDRGEQRRNEMEKKYNCCAHKRILEKAGSKHSDGDVNLRKKKSKQKKKQKQYTTKRLKRGKSLGDKVSKQRAHRKEKKAKSNQKITHPTLVGNRKQRELPASV